jgi:hypothetical protein
MGGDSVELMLCRSALFVEYDTEINLFEIMSHYVYVHIYIDFLRNNMHNRNGHE